MKRKPLILLDNTQCIKYNTVHSSSISNHHNGEYGHGKS